MRIFYAAESAPSYGLLGSKIWYYNLFLPLVDLGHEVIPFQHEHLLRGYGIDATRPENQASLEKPRRDFGEALLAEVKKTHDSKPLDVFFSYFTSAHVLPEVIREIGTLGIATINWYCNASYQFHLVKDLAPAYDYCLVPEQFRLEDYRNVGANPIYCQEAANPQIYHPFDESPVYDVTFVGQRYGNRPEYVDHLIQKGIDVRVWGVGWLESLSLHRSLRYRMARRVRRLFASSQPIDHMTLEKHYGSTLSDEEYIRMYSRSKISLGFSTVAAPEGEIKQVRLRDFEAVMSGAFYLAEQFDELADFFEPDKEIVFFNSKEELLDKVRYFLTHEAEREAIRQAGMRRARSEHTWQKRFETVFKTIGLA